MGQDAEEQGRKDPVPPLEPMRCLHCGKVLAEVYLPPGSGASVLRTCPKCKRPVLKRAA